MTTSPVMVETRTGSQLTYSGISGLGWAALLWVLLVMPIWSAHFPELMPGLRELEATGSRNAWLQFWMFSTARAWFGFFLCLAALKREGYTVGEIRLTAFLPRFYKWAFGLIVVFSLGVILARYVGVYSPPPLPECVLPARFQALFLTASSGELIVMLGRALTAGVCEETMYRGFAFTYLNRLFGRMWPGVLLATLVFGYGHAYTGQGVAGVGATFVVGLVLAGLFFWRKSLWPGILLHSLLDVFQLLVVLPSR